MAHTALLIPSESRQIAPEDAPFNLEKCVRKYSSQPDLLELILSSKVEEDRRRSEEAKLKRKQIELILHNVGTERRNSLPVILSRSVRLGSPPARYPPRIRYCDSANEDQEKQLLLEPMPPSMPQHRRNSINNLLTASSSVTLPPIRVSSPTGSSIDSFPSRADVRPRLPYNESDHRPLHHVTKSAPPSPPTEPILLAKKGKLPIPPLSEVIRDNKRQRRNAQAITAIVETREFPYNDEYLWKNNGNTVRKSSGKKSIYYKCANCNKGCPVNKTVAFKDDGQYLIKYRGEHLKDCNRIKHISNV